MNIQGRQIDGICSSFDIGLRLAMILRDRVIIATVQLGLTRQFILSKGVS